MTVASSSGTAAPRPRFLGLSDWLDRNPAALALYGGLSAFGAYFAMYAYRRPFAAAGFEDVGGVLPAGLDYKSALVIAQVCGYALSKFIGIKIVSEMPLGFRAAAILILVGSAELALVGFAYVAPPWNVALMFLNGLPLGMIWGLVFSFVEGRRTTELLGSILCASFIVSSGAVKAVGKWLLLAGWAGEMTMPMLTGLIFAPLLFVSVLGLLTLPPPNQGDVVARVRRAPMDGDKRREVFATYAPGLIALIALYVLLTAMRDFRDNFAAEIWTDLGRGGNAEILALSELPVGAVVLVAMALLALVKSNRGAVVTNLGLIGLGLVVAGLSSILFALHALDAVAWMILLGAGLYLAYTPYNGALFERMVAASGKVGTAGFFIYIADSCGYAGSVALVLVKSLSGLKLPWAAFIMNAAIVTSLLGVGLIVYSARYFLRKMGA